MQSKAEHPNQYIAELPEDKRIVIEELRKVISINLPEGYQEVMSYGMIGYVVPHELYPNGYHCNPKLPLPFMNIASQKNFIALYHMGIYANPELLNWFVSEYPKHCKSKLDMGKGCIRFKKMDDIPYDLIGELCQKMTIKEWINTYESAIKKK